MNFLKFFTSIFDSLFKSSSKDGKAKSELKHIENELKLHVPTIYKNGALMANVAEAFVLLYTNTKHIEEILSSTIKSSDPSRARAFANRLIMTGLSSETLELQQGLSFEARKEAVIMAENENKVFADQAKAFEQFLKIFEQEEFTQINQIIAKLYQLFDICRFNFFRAIRAFVPNFTEHTDLEKVEIKNVPIQELETPLMDLYFVAKDFQITSSMAKAIIALETIHAGDRKIDQDKILNNLKKISYIFRHILQPTSLHQLVMLSKQDPGLVLESARYNSTALQSYIEHAKKQFEADTNRIRMEVQDEIVAGEINSLFKDREQEVLAGYNSEQNEFLLLNGTSAFTLITPMQILKTFLLIYADSHIQSLLNDIVIEGFFYNPTYKTEFSTAVFSVLEAHERIKNFENSFDRNNVNDIAVIRGYVADAQGNPDFSTKLLQAITRINTEAKKILQEEVAHLLNLQHFLSDMLEDARLISPVNITNIKVLLASSRNKDNAVQLENQLPDWQIFFGIMKNYVVLGEKEKQ